MRARTCFRTGVQDRQPQPKLKIFRKTAPAKAGSIVRDPFGSPGAEEFMNVIMLKRRTVVTLLALTAALSSTSAARADVVSDWNTAALNAIRADKPPPPRASRALT